MIALVRLTDRDIDGAGLPLKVAQAIDAARTDGLALLASPGAAMTVVDHDGRPQAYAASLFGEPWMTTASRIVNRLTTGARP